MRAGWALLRRRDFGLLWAGGLISETGDWFLLVGLPVWVFQLTGSSLVTATVFLVGLLPSLVVGPLAGVLVDRWDRRRTLVAVSLAQAAFLLPLLAVDGRDRLWVVYLVMAVEAVLAQLNDPARNALVPSLVARDDLVGANALIGLNGNLARLVGSPLGGVLVEVAGLPGLVIGDAVSFLLGAALHRPGPPAQASWRRAPEGEPTARPIGRRRLSTAAARPSRAGVVREWVDGLRVTVRDHGLRWGLVVNGMAGVAQGIFTVLFVLFVTEGAGRGRGRGRAAPGGAGDRRAARRGAGGGAGQAAGGGAAAGGQPAGVRPGRPGHLERPGGDHRHLAVPGAVRGRRDPGDRGADRPDLAGPGADRRGLPGPGVRHLPTAASTA